MPEFSNPFAALANDRKITKEELIRAIRYSIAAEYEAIQLYMQLAESTDDKLSIDVLKDIADEERVHAGEFMRLLKHLEPKEMEFYAEGAEEVEEIMKELGDNSKENSTPQKGDGAKVDLPFCTTAPDPEHARAHNEDEPCDDGRAGSKEQQR